MAVDRLAVVGDQATAALARSRLAVVRWSQGWVSDARRLAEEAVKLAQESGDRGLIARSLALLGGTQAAGGARTEATLSFEQAMGWLQSDDPGELAAAIHICIAQLDLAGARAAQKADDADGLERRLNRADERVVAVLGDDMGEALSGKPSIDLRLLAAVWQTSRLAAEAEQPHGD